MQAKGMHVILVCVLFALLDVELRLINNPNITHHFFTFANFDFKNPIP